MDTKIGMALPFRLFSNPEGREDAFSLAFGGFDRLLDFCETNLYSIELRSVSSNADPRVVLDAVKALKSRGLAVTVHGKLCEAEDFFAPYFLLFESGLQEMYNVTVHPDRSPEETERILRDICEIIDKENYPVRITLENQKLKKDKHYGICDEVSEIAKRINSPHLWLCFDFEHQLSNALGELSVSFFEGAHFLNGNGVPEYGFAIRRGEETFVFPADVRDYCKPTPRFENVRALFANLWLGCALALKPYEQYINKFCDFIKRFDADNCYVAHLLETDRDLDNMWSDIHLEAVKKELPFVIAPKIGERIKL